MFCVCHQARACGDNHNFCHLLDDLSPSLSALALQPRTLAVALFRTSRAAALGPTAVKPAHQTPPRYPCCAVVFLLFCTAACSPACANGGRCVRSGVGTSTCNCTGTGFTGTICTTPLQPDLDNGILVCPRDAICYDAGPGLLAVVPNPYNNTLTVVNVDAPSPAVGTLDVQPDGSFVYTAVM